MALVGGGADDRVAAGADARLAGVGLGAGVAVVAGACRSALRVRAGAGRGIAGAARRGTGRRRCRRPGSPPVQTPVWQVSVCGAGVAVVAGVPSAGVGVRARAGRGIAGPGVVALVGGGADHRVAAGADAGLAGVGLGAGVAVVARRPVGGVRGSSRRPSRDCRCRRRGTGRRRVQTTGLPPVQTPAWQVSRLACRRCRRCTVVPSAAFGFEQTPVAGSQVPATWHWSGAVQTTGLPPVHDAGLAGVGVAGRAGVAVVAGRAVGRFGFEQMPVAGLQVPATWHWSVAVQTTGLPPAQVPAWQVSSLPWRRCRRCRRCRACRWARSGSSRRRSRDRRCRRRGTGRRRCRPPGCRRCRRRPGRCRSAWRAGVAVVAGRAVRRRPGSSRRRSRGRRCRRRGTGPRPCRRPGSPPTQAPAWQVSRLRAGVAVVARRAVRRRSGSSRRRCPGRRCRRRGTDPTRCRRRPRRPGSRRAAAGLRAVAGVAVVAERIAALVHWPSQSLSLPSQSSMPFMVCTSRTA